MTIRKFGHIFDTPSRKALRADAAAILGASPTFPPAASLEKFEAAILDQGQSGSCTGASAAQGLYTAFASYGKPLPQVPSPDALYKGLRAVERAAAFPTGRALPALTDSGAMLSDYLPFLAKYGIRPMKGPTPDGRNYDLWTADDVQGLNVPANVNDEIDLLELEQSGQKLISGEYRINESAPNFPDLICAAIAGTGTNQSGIGVPTAIGCWVDQAVMNFAKGQAPLSSFSTQSGGGHAICITSYRTMPDGKRVFRIANSWGATYGDAGHFEVTEDWLRAQVIAAGLDLYPWTIA